MKSIAKWITGILFGVAVVAVADDYVHVRYTSKADRKTRREYLDKGSNAGVVWNYYDN